MKRCCFALLLIITGCSAGPQVLPIIIEPTRLTSYELGQEEIGKTGDAVIVVARAFKLPTYTPTRRVEGSRFSARPGDVWVARWQFSDGDYLIVGPQDDRYGLRIATDGTLKGGLYNSNTARKVYDQQLMGVLHFEAIDGPPQEGSFVAELIYSGQSNNTIRLVYREYLDGLARPPFTQELEYDLSESTAITFKSLEIDVIEATNNHIRFMVREDGDLPWLPNR